MVKSLKEQFDYLFKAKWSCDDSYHLFFMRPEEHSKCINIISILRKQEYISLEFACFAMFHFNFGLRHFYKFKEESRNQPRVKAQKFIGDKTVRNTVFDKYGKVCLCCGSDEDITIDHIVPVYHKGVNHIDNLQPLCRACNSSKGTKVIDYR